MIRRIAIKNYKSLRSVEVQLQSLSVLFGPNAAGKSNFIDALQLLSRIASGRSLKEAFEPPYRGKPMESFSFGKEGLEGLTKRDSASFEIEADVELSPFVVKAVNDEILDMKRPQAQPGNGSRSGRIHHRLLRYRIQIEISPASGICTLLMSTSWRWVRMANPKFGPTLSSSEKMTRSTSEWKVRPIPLTSVDI